MSCNSIAGRVLGIVQVLALTTATAGYAREDDYRNFRSYLADPIQTEAGYVSGTMIDVHEHGPVRIDANQIPVADVVGPAQPLLKVTLALPAKGLLSFAASGVQDPPRLVAVNERKYLPPPPIASTIMRYWSTP